jgi:hypothetical protein
MASIRFRDAQPYKISKGVAFIAAFPSPLSLAAWFLSGLAFSDCGCFARRSIRLRFDRSIRRPEDSF